MNGQPKKLSVIIPARNEEGNIPRVYEELTALKKRLPGYRFEFLIIDNCSEDRTGELARGICSRDPEWKYIRFSKNFGSEASIAAGLEKNTGDACIVLFSDLQDPPDRIPDLVAEWEKGSQIVFGIYEGTQHASWHKRKLTSVYYWLLKSLSDVPMVPFAGDFRLYDRRVVDELNRLQERNRYMRGLAQWIGFRTSFIRYERRERTSGKSKAPLFYLFSFAFSVLVNFSDKPLRMFTIFGIGIGVLASFLSLAVIANYFFRPVIPGLSTTHVLLTINLAVVALGFGILGEYISKIYIETKRRPLYIVDEAVGIQAES